MMHILPAESLTVFEVNTHGLLDNLVVFQSFVLCLQRLYVATGAKVWLLEVGALIRIAALFFSEVKICWLLVVDRVTGRSLGTLSVVEIANFLGLRTIVLMIGLNF